MEVVDESEVADVTGDGEIDEEVLDVEAEQKRAEGIALTESVG